MKVVISGSFRKHLQGILKLKKELEERGIEVIKPNRVKTIKNIDNPDFVKFEGEENIHPCMLESEYIDAIIKCDAHIIYNKDSYLGQSANYELGVSMTKGKDTKVYFIERPDPNKMIAQKGEIDEGEKQDIIEFCELLEDMERHGVLKIGIDQLYKDFVTKNVNFTKMTLYIRDIYQILSHFYYQFTTFKYKIDFKQKICHLSRCY